MDLSQGATVRTPDGATGRIIKPTTGGGSPVNYNLDTQAQVQVYAVLLESGEVRFYSMRALYDASSEVRRSGSVK